MNEHSCMSSFKSSQPRSIKACSAPVDVKLVKQAQMSTVGSQSRLDAAHRRVRLIHEPTVLQQTVRFLLSSPPVGVHD